ncbi:fibronectin type III domain-containing protein, partial [Methanocalculus sp.]|uniref:fibronectin type III domain-containing protein n=1 Tax=Methanocalculus sp. TaxID=2004547 RepID=UPI00271C36DB
MRLGILCIVILGLAMSMPSGVFADLHDDGGVVGSYEYGDDGSSGNYHLLADTGATLTVATPEIPRSGVSAGIASASIADFTSTGKTTTTALFTWTQAVNATALLIEQSSDGGVSWSGATHAPLAPTAASATVTGLSPGTLYHFRLAVTGGENSGVSNIVSVTTDAVPPTDFTSTGNTATTALFTWTQAVKATAVAIEQSRNGGISWSGATHGPLAPTAASATVTGLSPGTLYRFRLAVTGGENAGVSNVVSVTTNAAPPILSSAITNMDGTRIILSFNKIMANPVGEQGS